MFMLLLLGNLRGFMAFYDVFEMRTEASLQIARTWNWASSCGSLSMAFSALEETPGPGPPQYSHFPVHQSIKSWWLSWAEMRWDLRKNFHFTFCLTFYPYSRNSYPKYINTHRSAWYAVREVPQVQFAIKRNSRNSGCARKMSVLESLTAY